jgi:hypothetical protein
VRVLMKTMLDSISEIARMDKEYAIETHDVQQDHIRRTAEGIEEGMSTLESVLLGSR